MPRENSMRSLTVHVPLLMTLAIPALAADGVLEINQTCALNTGCFAGDSAGLPVTISTAGSYKLTSNLVVPNENTDGIVVGSGNVSIDLAGFEIRGVVVCSGPPLVCTPSTGTGSGVEVTSTSLPGILVRNGSITGMGRYGVLLGVQAEVMQLRARSNRVVGIEVADVSTVSGNSAHFNGFEGITVGNGSTVSGNTAYSNGSGGIQVGGASTISGNTAYANGDIGIFANTGSTISGNTVFSNGSTGISTILGSTVSGNTAYGNGGGGISTGTGSTVSGNTVRINTGFGLNLGPQSGYRENVITSNTAGTVTGTGLVNLGNNACNGTAVCP
jgi:parallel beta-helix repeat protein